MSRISVYEFIYMVALLSVCFFARGRKGGGGGGLIGWSRTKIFSDYRCNATLRRFTKLQSRVCIYKDEYNIVLFLFAFVHVRARAKSI